MRELKELNFLKKFVTLSLIIIFLICLDFLDKVIEVFPSGYNVFLENIIVKTILILIIVISFKYFNIKIFGLNSIKLYDFLKITVITLLIIIFDYTILSDKTIWNTDVKSEWVLIFFSTVICIPIYEELIYRYLILSVFSRPRIVGVLLSTIIFTASHNPYSLGDIVFYLSMSLFLSYVYIKYNSIELCIYIHMLTNFIYFISIV